MKYKIFQIKALSLNDLKKEYPDLIYSSWFSSEKFAKEKAIPGSYEIALEPVKDSINKDWNQQQKLLKKGEVIPTIAVLVQAMILHYQETKERLFSYYYVRCSDITSGGYRVVVGRFYADGLDVYGYWDDGPHSSLGLSASRFLEPGKPEPFESLNSRDKNGRFTSSTTGSPIVYNSVQEVEVTEITWQGNKYRRIDE